MDFSAMFAQLTQQPAFAEALAKRFEAYCVEKKIPAQVQHNHLVTWNAAAQAGADVLSEIVGDVMAKHPYLAKQALKMMEG